MALSSKRKGAKKLGVTVSLTGVGVMVRDAVATNIDETNRLQQAGKSEELAAGSRVSVLGNCGMGVCGEQATGC